MLKVNDTDLDSNRMTDGLLAERLRAANKASTAENGEVDFDWLVMHIWLAANDSIQAAYATANGCVIAGGDGEKSFEACIDKMHQSLKRVLPVVLPLVAEFASPKEIMRWRNSGGADRAVSTSAFLRRGCEAGIPLAEDDLVYAMGPDGPFGELAFTHTASRVRRAIPA